MENPMVEAMRAGLRELMNDTADWGVLLYFQYAGDVPFLTPIRPALRGVEIVYEPLTETYDLWRKGRLMQPSLTLSQVGLYLRGPIGTELEQHVAQWTEETLDYYGVKKEVTV